MPEHEQEQTRLIQPKEEKEKEIKPTRFYSFGSDIDAGIPKQEIMLKRCMTDSEYERALKSLYAIRAAPKQEKKKYKK